MNETIRSRVGFWILTVWMTATVMMGKEVDLATVVIASFHISHTQVALLILLGLTVSFWRDFFMAKGLRLSVFYLGYLLLGLLAIAFGYYNGSTLKYVLGSAGIFYYALFFYIAFVLVNSDSRRRIFLSALFYSWLIGALIFIVDFALEQNGRFPFGIHLSSDLLPMLAGCLVVLAVALPRAECEITGSRCIGIFALLFLIMVNTKGVITAAALLSGYAIYRKFVHRRKAGYFSILEHKFGLLILLLGLSGLFESILIQLDATTIENYVRSLPFSDVESRSILIRLYMWEDISMQIISGPIWGYGLIPFNSELIAQKVLNLPEWSQNPEWSQSINPHNSYLYLAYFVGWIGPAIYLLLTHTVHRVIHDCNDPADLSASAVAVYLAVGVFMLAAMATPVFEEPWLAPFMWILMGVACRQAIAKQTRSGSYR